jgi:hypothetical protein
LGEDNDGIFTDHAGVVGVSGAAPASPSGGGGIEEEEEAKVQLFEVSISVEPRRRVHTTDTCASL